MYLFLLPLLTGFLFNWTSAFTGFFSRHFGESKGRWITFILRNILGIPVWSIGLVLAYREPSTALLPASAILEISGWVLIAAGSILILWAVWLLGWRAFRPTTQDTLVSGGPYSRIRHPIHTGVLLEFLGLILVRSTLPGILACSLGCLYVYIQSRLEEFDLLSRMPSYREYMERLPRFVPRIGSKPAGRS
jgi:protein-S-isoprenylcysteine O-methyltransferase Ste14